MSNRNVVYLSKQTVDLSFIKIKENDVVVIKPNLIRQGLFNTTKNWDCVITGRDLIRQVCEYVCKKVSSRGRVIICDAPQTDSDFNEICKLLELQELIQHCFATYNICVELYDLRQEIWITDSEIVESRAKSDGDPNGNIVFNLKQQSLFYGHIGEGKYYGADYDTSIVNNHHAGLTQEYLLARTPFIADVFINLPKLKTHKKTGVTLSLKNVVGINTDKNWLPHHVNGSPVNGGDQYPKTSLREMAEQFFVVTTRQYILKVPLLGTLVAKKFREAGKKVFGATENTIRSGNWYGNNTTWRMALDINRCLFYGDRNGTIGTSTNRRYYTVIDGVIGMEGQGPAHGEPVLSNVYIAGEDPVLVDTVAARFMGFDWRKIPIIKEAYALAELPITIFKPDDIVIKSNVDSWNGKFSDVVKREKFMKFKPPLGWGGHIEAE